MLRWFETLPAIERGEDVELLVADDDIAKMDDLQRQFEALHRSKA